ncbi:MAG: N-acetylmuramoyl-L-alanine amidase family protein [Alkalispirochaetaceae bacterium]
MVYPRQVIATLLIFLSVVFAGAQETAPTGRSLLEFAEAEGLDLQWDPLRRTATLWRRDSSVTLRVGDETMLFNYAELERLEEPAISEAGADVRITAAAVGRIEERMPDPGPVEERRVIAGFFIDPGHGGKDPGTVGRHVIDGETVLLQEKDLVLQAAQLLGTRLRERYPSKQVLLSRNEDVYLTLEERTRRANGLEVEPDETVIFISIHANASLNSKARGFEVWYLPPEYRRPGLVNPDRVGVRDPEVLTILNTIREEEVTLESILLGRNILAGLESRVGDESANRGLKEESWYVVRNARMPSVLIELGFVTNMEEFLRLREPSYLNKLVDGIYTGITNFVRSFESYGRE